MASCSSSSTDSTIANTRDALQSKADAVTSQYAKNQQSVRDAALAQQNAIPKSGNQRLREANSPLAAGAQEGQFRGSAEGRERESEVTPGPIDEPASRREDALPPPSLVGGSAALTAG